MGPTGTPGPRDVRSRDRGRPSFVARTGGVGLLEARYGQGGVRPPTEPVDGRVISDQSGQTRVTTLDTGEVGVCLPTVRETARLQSKDPDGVGLPRNVPRGVSVG